MDRYTVAVLSLFENENKLFIVEADSESEAICKATVEFDKSDEDFTKWVESMKGKSVDELIGEFSEGELAVSTPIKV